jgi:tetratricopeptide (TPR) repeat protein/class 3 adenylate cyclase
LIRYIPPFILNHYEHETRSGSFPGYVLFFDVADFTGISAEFRKHGKRGAEEMIHFMDQVFGIPIGEIERNGGFVNVFAGDAFCAIFPDGYPENFIAAVNRIRLKFRENPIYSSDFGDFDLSVKMTVAHGDISWRIFRNEHQCEYIFYGEVMQEMAVLAGYKEQLIFSPSAVQQLGSEKFRALDHGFDLQVTDDQAADFTLEYSYQPDTPARFIHPRFAAETPANEIRDAAFCFADFSRIEESQREAAVAIFHEVLDAYGGLLNKLDATDKGLVGLILFGMPKSKGRTLESISRFALKVISRLPQLSLGIACGPVFAGRTGSSRVNEYTALGDAVNLAARLMGRAQPGEILVDDFLYRELRSRFEFSDHGEITLKGFSQPVNVHQLEKSRQREELSFSSEFVGREEEISLLKGFIESPDNCIVYVSGEAGVGKSRLIDATLNYFSSESMQKYFIFCDPVTRKPLEPIKQIIHSYFQFDPLQSMEQNRERFRTVWAELAGDDPELIRIESIVASLLDLTWEHSVWSYLPAEEKPKQLKQAFATFINALAQRLPLLIHFDDPQWCDNSSREFLQQLGTEQIQRVNIIAACRYLADGSTVDLELPGFNCEKMNLGSLSESGSELMISQLLGIEQVPQATLDIITTRAEHNPLFIEQLIAYLQENDLIDPDGVITGDTGFLSTFGIADIIGGRLDQLTEKVRECLFSASVLGLEFNTRVLSRMLNHKIDTDLTAGKSSRVWRDLDELNYIFTHILIKDIAYQRMVSTQLKELHRLAAVALQQVYPDNLEQHAEEIGSNYEKAGSMVEAASFLTEAGLHYKQQYILDRAEAMMIRALTIREEFLGPDHPDVAESLSNVANLYFVQADYARAEPLCKRSLTIREEVLGSDHPDVAESLHNLAELYLKQGKYDKGESLSKRSLAIREEVLGPDHLDVGTSLSTLAALNASLGDYARAETLYVRSLSIYEKALGPDHPEVASVLNNLAVHYLSQGKYAMAEQHLERSLAIREKARGAEHPDVALSLNNLAELYLVQGNYSRIESLSRRSLSIWEKKLGPDHPDVALALNSLAHLFVLQGNYDKAEPLLERTLTVREKALGPDHPRVALTLNDLGGVYLYRGEYSRAEPPYDRALAIREKVLSQDHPRVAESLINRALLYFVQGDYARAEPLYLRALEILEKILGPDHFRVGHCLKLLAQLYSRQGDYARAEPLYERSLSIGEEALGPDHPDVAVILNRLATLHIRQGNYARAEPLLERTLTIREEALGSDHLDVAETLISLAVVNFRQGDYARVEPLLERSLTIREKGLGLDHPYVAIPLLSLAGLYFEQGDYTRAEPLFERSLAIREKALGSKHPDVAKSLDGLVKLYRVTQRKSEALELEKRAERIRANNDEHSG